MGQLRLALRSLGKAIHISPADPALYAQRAQILLSLGRKEASLEDWWRALSLTQPKTLGDWRQLVLIQLRLGRPQRAILELERLLDVFEGRGRATVKALLGRAQWLSGDRLEAKERFNEAVADDPLHFEHHGMYERDRERERERREQK